MGDYVSGDMHSTHCLYDVTNETYRVYAIIMTESLVRVYQLNKLIKVKETAEKLSDKIRRHGIIHSDYWTKVA